MRVDLLADDTLVAFIPGMAASDATETLAVFGLVVAKKGLSIPVDEVRAVVLQFGVESESDEVRRQRTEKKPV